MSHLSSHVKKKEEANKKTCLGKCGSLIKTLFVISVVASMAIPMFVEIYNKLYNKDQSILDAEYDTVSTKSKDRMTPEEIR